MKVLVLGSSGIVGQHLRLSIPRSVTATFFRQSADPITPGADLLDFSILPSLLSSLEPGDAVINLAGESSPDTVQGSESSNHFRLNVLLPQKLAQLCQDRLLKYVHVSSQSVFDGHHPPYSSLSPVGPAANDYGDQKLQAERRVSRCKTSVIVRLTFVLGIRPMPHTGRKNPLESMFDGSQKLQVSDRWFSPVFARDAAQAIWDAATSWLFGEVHNIGIPQTYSRYDIAKEAYLAIGKCDCFSVLSPVPHSWFANAAPRPIDTTYDYYDSIYTRLTESHSLSDGLKDCKMDYTDDVRQRAREIALFLGMREDDALQKLSTGFFDLHHEVSDDFRSYMQSRDYNSLENLQSWYRTTLAYIWELSAYHADSIFNYMGMANGVIVDYIGCGLVDPSFPILCLGDGIGDLTLLVHRAGLSPIYHDLEGSRTAAYAAFRFWNATGLHLPHTLLTTSWEPPQIEPQSVGCVVSFDYLEHVPNLEEWVRFAYSALVPGGLFHVKNAFACGSGKDGGMPMHLACNDKYADEQTWDKFCEEVGFVRTAAGRYQRKKE